MFGCFEGKAKGKTLSPEVPDKRFWFPWLRSFLNVAGTFTGNHVNGSLLACNKDIAFAAHVPAAYESDPFTLP